MAPQQQLVALDVDLVQLEAVTLGVQGDDLLLRRYLERIPVVEVDGIDVSELVLDAAAVKARLDTVGAWSR